MEAAGGAVGIISLGIQVRQGLLSYFDSWKGYNSDIDGVYSSIADLSKTLALLIPSLESDDLDEERTERVKAILVTCEDALEELSELLKRLRSHREPEGLRRTTWAEVQKLWYPFRKKTLANLESNVREVREHLKLAIQLLQLDTESESRKLLTCLSTQSKHLSASVDRISAQSQRIVDHQTSVLFNDIVAWISPANPWANHDAACQRHERDTCDWLLQHEQYQRWKRGELDHLWMHGKAGCGKTILCSVAIQDIHAHCFRNPNIAYAMFYFSFSDFHKRSSTDVLRSLVAQLGCKEPNLSILLRAYEHRQPDRSIIGSEELERILLACITSYDKVFVLMDALDECPDEDDTRENVLQLVHRITQQAANLKIFASSREIAPIRDAMAVLGSEALGIANASIDADIRKYVSSQLSGNQRFCAFDPEVRDLIRETIVARSGGMFRWAHCQLHELAKLKSKKPKYVREALTALPTTLDDTYTRILCGIEGMYHQEAFTLLQWLAYARSPLSLQQLSEAAIIDPGSEIGLDENNRGGLEDVINILSELITIETVEKNCWSCSGSSVASVESAAKHGSRSVHVLDGPVTKATDELPMKDSQNHRIDTIVRLAHFSVKEYLESNRIISTTARSFSLDSSKAHDLIARSCLAYLRYYSASKTQATGPFFYHRRFPLLQYATDSWYHHSRLRQSCNVDCEVSFLISSKQRIDWLLVDQAITPEIEAFELHVGKPIITILDQNSSALYYAIILGLRCVASELLRTRETVGTPDKDTGLEFALVAASCTGQAEVVKLILERGVNPNAKGGSKTTALYNAVRNNASKTVVSLLLEYGAKVNSSGGRNHTALALASARGYEDLVQLMLNYGCDVDGIELDASPILEAAYYGHKNIVQLLLERGADPNAYATRYHGFALHAAARRGFTDVVQLLLDRGANIDAKGSFFDNAIATSSVANESLLQFILERGSNVGDTAQRSILPSLQGPQMTALQLASYRGYTEMVQLLLVRGADVSQDDKLFNPLQLAFRQGHKDIVELLHERVRLSRASDIGSPEVMLLH